MSDDDFLSRWSRRKRAVKDDEQEASPELAAPSEEEAAHDEDESELLARLNLPIPETLKPGDDFSAFMADGVPQFLRKRALRVLWRSNPVLANLDGLNDYDEDFTSPKLTQKVLATAYKVGRGIVSQATEPMPVEAEESVKELPPMDQPDEALVVENTPENQPPVNTVVHNEEDVSAPRPRRMRFET